MGSSRTSSGSDTMKMRTPWLSSLGWAAVRCLVAAVFLYSGIAKLPASLAFAGSIARFQVLPDWLINPVALALPPLEVILATALLVGRWRRQAAFGLAVLGTVFLVALISAAARGLPVECACFGHAAAEPLWILIVRDLLIAAGAIATYRRLSPEPGGISVKTRSDEDELNPALRCLQ